MNNAGVDSDVYQAKGSDVGWMAKCQQLWDTLHEIRQRAHESGSYSRFWALYQSLGDAIVQIENFIDPFSRWVISLNATLSKYVHGECDINALLEGLKTVDHPELIAA